MPVHRVPPMIPVAPRIVLDTNVWLDLLLFEDPRAARLRAALDSHAVAAVTNDDCRAEWLRVLHYPQLQLDEAGRERLLQAFDALVEPLAGDAGRQDAVALPRCADRDDQKFVQLAFDSSARWLLSRDRDVLALGRRTARAGWFEIVTPQAWSPPTGPPL